MEWRAIAAMMVNEAWMAGGYSTDEARSFSPVVPPSQRADRREVALFTVQSRLLQASQAWVAEIIRNKGRPHLGAWRLSRTPVGDMVDLLAGVELT